MVPSSPAEALGSHADVVRDAVIDVVRTRHVYSAEAHQVARTRYGSGFGTQWRDLLDDAHAALTGRGFRSYTLTPGGYKLPVVNDCLVYVWRVPNGSDAVKNFASSPTRLSGFVAPPPPPMLWEGYVPDEVASDADSAGTAMMIEALREKMRFVLVLVWSTPRQLQSIDWAVAELDGAGKVQLHGHESVWRPELVADGPTPEIEPFDSGAPVAPVVELQRQSTSDE